MMRGLFLCAAALLGLSGCPAGEPCGDGPACHDDEQCLDGACAAAASRALVSVASFTATPSRVNAGSAATLSWTTRNAATCSLSPSFGAVPRSGSVEVQPAASSSWTLSCEGAGGPAEAEVTVTVLGGLDAGPDDGGAIDGGGLDAGGRDGGALPDAAVLADAHDVPDAGALGSEVVSSEDVEVLAEPPLALTDADGETRALLFRERAAVVLDEWHMADLSYPASWGATADLTDAEPRVQLVPGHVLDSWLLHAFSATGERRTGSFSFSREVVAIIWRDTTLIESDAIFAAPDVVYGSADNRGFGATYDDVFTLSDDRRTVSFGVTGVNADELRVLVDANPSPRPRVQTWTVTLDSATDLRAGMWLDAEHALLLDEGSTTLSGGLPVSFSFAGRYTAANFVGSTLSEGTALRSWLVHFNPPTAAGENLLTLSVTFERPILGVITEGTLLSFSDLSLGLADVLYPADGENRGLELSATESVWWAPDGRSLRATLRVPAAGGIDELRVLTEP